MSKLDRKFIDLSINDLQDVSLGGSQPANNSIIIYDDTAGKWVLSTLGGLKPLKRVISDDLLIQEDEFLIVKNPRLRARMIVQGQLKVV